MISIKVNIENEVSEELAAFISALTGPEAAELNEQGGIAARNAAIAYHRQFDQSGGWRGKRYLGPSQNNGSDFGADVARGWMLESHTSNGAVISNDAAHYAFKVSGGTITPKRAKALTIPLVPEARGVRASVYTQNTGHRLFTIKGKHALFERTGAGGSLEPGTIARVRRKNGTSKSAAVSRTGVRAVYALVKSVTMGPWAGALPPDDVIVDAYAETYREGLIGILEKS